MERFGRHFYQYCENEAGYGQILSVLGSDLESFLQSMDALHNHLLTFYPSMKAPNFTCEKDDQGLKLHYYSYRKGLERMVIGAVKVSERCWQIREVYFTVHTYVGLSSNMCSSLMSGTDI